MNDSIIYRVGDARDPRPEDSTFLELDAAIEDALIEAEEQECVIAVWECSANMGHATTVVLCWEDEVWYPR